MTGFYAIGEKPLTRPWVLTLYWLLLQLAATAVVQPYHCQAAISLNGKRKFCNSVISQKDDKNWVKRTKKNQKKSKESLEKGLRTLFKWKMCPC